jgi:hypothetical protein
MPGLTPSTEAAVGDDRTKRRTAHGWSWRGGSHVSACSIPELRSNKTTLCTCQRTDRRSKAGGAARSPGGPWFSRPTCSRQMPGGHRMSRTDRAGATAVASRSSCTLPRGQRKTRGLPGPRVQLARLVVMSRDGAHGPWHQVVCPSPIATGMVVVSNRGPPRVATPSAGTGRVPGFRCHGVLTSCHETAGEYPSFPRYQH